MGFFSKTIGNKYELGKTIGKGHFSKVKVAVNNKTGEQVAVKVMEYRALVEENMENALRREIAVMRKMNHPYVTKLIDVYQTEKHVYLVLELVTGGELFDKIVEEKKFSETMAKDYFRQLVLGIYFCHQNGIAHRDLKPENLLLDAKGRLKISDFGLSNMQNTNASGNVESGMQLHTMCGTPEYVAPEVILGGGYNGFKADIWSCGVILYVMCAGALPFREKGGVSVYHRIKSGVYEMKPHFSPELQDLLRHIIVVDPNRRYTLDDICKHPWMQPMPTAELELVRNIKAPTTNALDVEQAIMHTDDMEDTSAPRRSSVDPDDPDAPEMVSSLTRHRSFANPSFVEKKANMKFAVPGEPNQVVPIVMRAMEELNAHPESKVATTIKGSVEAEDGIVTFVVTIGTSSKNGATVVEVRRGRGSTLQFHETYHKMISKISAATAGGGASGSSSGGGGNVQVMSF